MQFQLLPLSDGLGKRIKNFQVENRFGARAEGDRLFNVGKVQRNGVGERLFHFANGAQERLFETGAAILLQCFLCDDERKNLALGDLHCGKTADLAGVEITIAWFIEFNRQG